MAEEAFKDDLEKSEEPTPKRREDAHKKGRFAKSRNLIPAATLLACAVGFRFWGSELITRMQACVVGFFVMAGKTSDLRSADLFDLAIQASTLVAPALLPFFGAVMLAAVATGFLQSGFVMASEPLHFDFSRVSPIAGFRRLFSLESAAELVKAVLFIAALGTVGGLYLYFDLAALTSLTGFSAGDIVVYMTREGAGLIAWVVGAMGTLAALDYFYQRWRTGAQLRMSRQEVKEEMREQEGDPLLKGALKSLRNKLSRRRMTAEVPKADVIITNPTELAIALRYRASEMAAPRVLGKGAGYVAQRIREIARENGIPIVENKPLAQLLYRQVEVGREIPEALYRAVAEVLAYVYRLRRGERVRPNFSPLQSNP